MRDFEGRHVVVTGGQGALGAAVVRLITDRGAVCHVPVQTDGVDLTDEACVAAYYRDLPGVWASIHCCGGFAMAPVSETSATDMRSLFELNAVSCFLCCREAVGRMRAAGRGGRIVNVTARPALEPTGGMIAYSASKAAVASITESLAVEVVAEGILVNAVVPSVIDSPANRAAMPDADHDRWPTPAQLAEAIGFLASPRNVVTAGALQPVYGQA